MGIFCTFLKSFPSYARMEQTESITFLLPSSPRDLQFYSPSSASFLLILLATAYKNGGKKGELCMMPFSSGSAYFTSVSAWPWLDRQRGNPGFLEFTKLRSSPITSPSEASSCYKEVKRELSTPLQALQPQNRPQFGAQRVDNLGSAPAASTSLHQFSPS